LLRNRDFFTSVPDQLAKKREFLIECSSFVLIPTFQLLTAQLRLQSIRSTMLTRMIGKRAKILSHNHVEDLLVFARQTRHPIRNQVLVLLSVKAGLRAGEIAHLTWQMLTGPTGEVGSSLELQDRASKKGSGRVIPIHPDLHTGLVKLARLTVVLDGAVIRSERGGPMTPVSIVCWFAKALSGNRLAGLFIPFGPPHLHHPSRPAGSQCRCFIARRSAPGWPPINPGPVQGRPPLRARLLPARRLRRHCPAGRQPDRRSAIQL
jgi:integrase